MPIESGLARFKLVISATRHGVHLHPSVESLPPLERKAAKEALEGELAATLLIADRTGLNRMRELMGRVDAESSRQSRRFGVPLSVARQVGLGFVVVGAVLLGLLLWAWFR